MTTLTTGFPGKDLRIASRRSSFPFSFSAISSDRVFRGACLALLFLCSAAAAYAQNSVAVYEPDSGYYLRKTYAVKAVDGSSQENFDGITVDAPARRVYVAHGTEVQVMDADSGALVGTIPGFTQNVGIAVASDLGRGFITDRAQAKVVIFDLSTLKTVGEAKTGAGVSNIIYDSASKRIFTMNAEGHSSTVIDANTGNVLKTIDLGGAPEGAVTDDNGTIYTSVLDKNEIVVIDSRALTIKARWPVAPAEAPSALSIDRQHRRLFTAGRNLQALVVMDADTGKVVQALGITANAGASAYDADTGLLFVSTGEGVVHIFHEDSPNKFSALEALITEYGAKTMSLDAKTHSLYLDTANFDPPPFFTEAPMRQPAPVPGTLHVLVYGKFGGDY